MRKCNIFVSIPGGDRFKEIYRKSIKPLESGNISISCFFDHQKVGTFEKNISVNIGYSNLVICVIGRKNPNILYEAGLALGYGKPLIIISESRKEIPTMLQQWDAILFDTDSIEYDILYGQLLERVNANLYGIIGPLRMRTHTALLLRQGEVLVSENNNDIDLLHKITREYNNLNYEKVIRLLTGVLIHEQEGAEQMYFYLCDSYFLSAESLPECGQKHAYYQKMLEIALQGNRVFPISRDLYKSVGLAYLKIKELGRAKHIFEKLVTDHPTYQVARYNLACVFAQTFEHFRAVKEMSILVATDSAWRYLARVDPDFEPIWYNELFQRLLFPMPQKDW
jgi:tetratricopeptide (TPR) repeat protein